METALSNRFFIYVFIPFLAVLATGSFYMDFLKKRYLGQYIREDGPESHQSKAGTPTMGGVLIIGAFLLGVGAMAVLDDRLLTLETWVVLIVVLIFAALGFIDDYQKITKKNNKGLSGYSKLAIQLSTGVAVGLFLMNNYGIQGVDVFGQTYWQLGWLFPVFTMLVITGASNAVNLTDGLDGLAAGCLAISFIALAAMLYNAQQPELTILTLILAGACLGFLGFNKHPAQVFMGDTGSLALGGALGVLGVLGGLPMWLLLIGGVYVLETLSVIIQVVSFKSTGKRVFRMAPLHHHFELGGMAETKVVRLFYGIQLVLALLACGLFFLS